MTDILANGHWLPLTFAALMGLAMLIYAVLDGYDLGVGILMPLTDDAEQDRMIASIGPFWDANETWLVLGVGLLLVAFPAAHGVILTNLYLPVAIMLLGLIMRGVAFDFRAKAHSNQKHLWNHTFFAGSLIAAWAQGFMLGDYILGFAEGWTAFMFALFVGACIVAGYALVGASWLIMKADGALQRRAVDWAQMASWGMVLGIILISITTPLVSTRIFDKWFSLPNVLVLAPIPLITGVLVLILERMLRQLPLPGDRLCWAPFAITVAIFTLCFLGLAYSFYPFIVPERMTIVDSAAAPESLMIILAGAAVVMPLLLVYTVVAYRIFRGKARDLTYD
ncbi:MAG: cytochrome d ubiquinol oxidase subunit II [Hyphomicrobiales bacterium]